MSRSIPATHCGRVVLPDPDRPLTAVNDPGAKVTLTPPDRVHLAGAAFELATQIPHPDRSAGDAVFRLDAVHLLISKE